MKSFDPATLDKEKHVHITRNKREKKIKILSVDKMHEWTKKTTCNFVIKMYHK